MIYTEIYVKHNFHAQFETMYQKDSRYKNIS